MTFLLKFELLSNHHKGLSGPGLCPEEQLEPEVLHISNNKLKDTGVKLLCEAIKYPKCHLEGPQWVSWSLELCL